MLPVLQWRKKCKPEVEITFSLFGVQALPAEPHSVSTSGEFLVTRIGTSAFVTSANYAVVAFRSGA
jgi:hypothetical protein